MEKIYRIVKMLAVACVIPLTVFACMFLWTLKETTQKTGATIAALPTQVDARVDKLQTDLLAKIDTVQDKLSSDLHFVANTGDSRLAILTDTANQRLGVIQDATMEQVKGLRADLNTQLTQTNSSVAALTTAYAQVPAILGSRLDKYTDCDKNELCWQGQFSDSMFAIRTTSRDVSDTMVGINHTLPIVETNITKLSDTFAVEVPKITTNVAGITDNINKLTHPHWYDRILGYVGLGVGVYRNLNPVTNLTITGTQMIANRP